MSYNQVNNNIKNQKQKMDLSGELSFLNCYICFQSLKKPKMCPSCSKVACQKCLRTWIEQKRPECPHCRKMMPLSNFAQCQRFISDVKHLLQAMDKSQKVKQKCKQHKIEMSYYCQDCNVPICSDCGMFGSEHRAHNITHLKRIYQQNKNKILNELVKFDQKIQNFRKNGYQIKLQMQKLVVQIGQRKSFIQEYFVAILQRLQQEFKQKQDKIGQKYESNSKQIEFMESFRENICKDLQISQENELITKSNQLIQYIQSVYDKKPQVEDMEHNFDTIHEIVPKYVDFKYALKDYVNLGQAIVYSDPYYINGIEWRLKIYPKGNGLAKQTHMSVFLQMTQGFSSGNKYEYKIELINQKNAKQCVIRQYSSNFDIGECWGYNQFILIEELTSQFITFDGSLVFNVSVRNPSYRSLVRDQKQYIDNLESKIKNPLNMKDVINEKKHSNKIIKLRESPGLPKQTKQKIKKFLNIHSQGQQNDEQDIQQGLPKMNKINSTKFQKKQKDKSQVREREWMEEIQYSANQSASNSFYELSNKQKRIREREREMEKDSN